MSRYDLARPASSNVLSRSRLPQPAAPAFSFVVPVYDRVQVVHEAIASCLNQTDPDLEVVVVLDGSPPETRAVVAAFADPRLRVFSYDHAFGHASRARNRGIVEARGDHVCFLDSDDWSSPTRLAAMREALGAEPEADVLYGRVRMLRGSASLSSRLFGAEGSFDATTPSLAELTQGNRIYMPTACVRRDVLLRFGGFRTAMRYREDHELWLRLLANGCRFVGVDAVVAWYRLHDDNLEKTFVADDAHWRSEALRLFQQPFDDWEEP